MDELNPEIINENDELIMPVLEPPEVPIVADEKHGESAEFASADENTNEVFEAENVQNEPANEKHLTCDELNEALEKSQTAVIDEIARINETVKDINARVSSLRKLADMHEDIENKLNTQINEYKDNFYRKIVNPILVEFFDIQEDMNLDALDSDEDTKKLLLGYVNDISTVFKHYGVSVETVSIGDTYDQRIHKPVKAVPTEDITLDKTVAKTRKTLVHSIDGRVVERASVNVYQYHEPETTKE